jgi:hypothetical protein
MRSSAESPSSSRPTKSAATTAWVRPAQHGDPAQALGCVRSARDTQHEIVPRRPPSPKHGSLQAAWRPGSQRAWM